MSSIIVPCSKSTRDVKMNRYEALGILSVLQTAKVTNWNNNDIHRYIELLAIT